MTGEPRREVCMAVTLHTIGHSDHPVDGFIDLVAARGIGIVCDVRTAPYSRRHPQFNREPLARSFGRRGISYFFLGNELGGRNREPGSPDRGGFDFIASTERFARGIERLREIMLSGETAVMCAERDPIVCHRMLLVCRALRAGDTRIRHILADGTVEEHSDTERRLAAVAGIPPTDLFDTPEGIIGRAYDLQWRSLSGGERENDEETAV